MSRRRTRSGTVNAPKLGGWCLHSLRGVSQGQSQVPCKIESLKNLKYKIVACTAPVGERDLLTLFPDHQ